MQDKVNRNALTNSNNLYNTIINNKTSFLKSTDFLFHIVRIRGWVGGWGLKIPNGVRILKSVGNFGRSLMNAMFIRINPLVTDTEIG